MEDVEAMLANAVRDVCESVRDAAHPQGAGDALQERLQAVLSRAASLAPATNTVFRLKEILDTFRDGFLDQTHDANGLSARLHAMRSRRRRPGDDVVAPVEASGDGRLPAALAGLSGDDLFRALLALRLPAAPATAPDVHLEVALAVRRLNQHYHLEIFVYVDVVEQMICEFARRDCESVYQGRTGAFFHRRDTLDSFAEAHINLADSAAAAAAAPPAGPGN